MGGTAGALHEPSSSSSSLSPPRGRSGRSASWLIFEPEEGPGEYELYTGCAAHELGSEPQWAGRLPLDNLAAMPSALLLRREARGAVLGPSWHEPPWWGGYGARRASLGNVRARLLVSAADARRGAVRAHIPWRRRQRLVASSRSIDGSTSTTTRSRRAPSTRAHTC